MLVNAVIPKSLLISRTKASRKMWDALSAALNSKRVPQIENEDEPTGKPATQKTANEKRREKEPERNRKEVCPALVAP